MITSEAFDDIASPGYGRVWVPEVETFPSSRQQNVLELVGAAATNLYFGPTDSEAMMTSSRRVLVPTVLAVLVLGAASGAVFAAGPDVADPKYPRLTYTPTSDEAAVQEELEVVAAKLEATAGDHDQFGGVALDLASTSVDLWWRGQVPPEVAEIIRSASVPVDLRAAKFTQQELEEAARRLNGFASPKGDYTVQWVGIQELSSPTPEHGLFVRIAGLSGGNTIAEAARELTAAAGIPVRVDGAIGAITEKGRQNDSAPWYGGSMMVRDDLFYCSTGFSVTDSSDASLLLTAGHCDPSQNHSFKNNAGSVLSYTGHTTYRYGLDSLLVDPSGSTGPWVHGGPWNATSANARYHLPVRNRLSTSIGSSVCISGANSGEHCNVVVTGMSIGACGTSACTQFAGSRADGSVNQAGGDSGGPVYANRSDGGVSARGIFVAGSSGLACPSTAVPAAGTCGSYGVWYEISDVLNTWNATLEVN